MQHTESEMTCKQCNKIAKRNGRDRYGNQRYRCVICNKTFIEPKTKTLGTMTLAEDKALMCLNLLVEGNSIRSIERITGVHRDTVLSLLETVGKKCLAIQENLVRDVKVKFVQADEIMRSQRSGKTTNMRLLCTLLITTSAVHTRLCTVQLRLWRPILRRQFGR